MAEIIQKNLGKFLVTLTLVSVFIAGFFIFSYFSARAQEEIKILPESFTGDWQNPEAVFSQDLGSAAAWEEFSQKNSAYPLELAKEVTGTGLWMRFKNLFKPEAQAESSVCKNGANQSCSTEVGACRIGVQICQDGVWGKCIGGVFPAQEICDGVDNNCDGQIDEGACAPETCQNGANRPCSSDIGACRIGIQICQDGVWGKCIGAKTPSLEICDQVDNDCDGQTDEGGVCGGKSTENSSPLIEKTLVLAGFGITPIENSKIKLAQLKLSLAGKGSAGDKFIIDYFYQDVWHNLAVFNLENEISNALNGGFFVYGLPIFENWSDLNDLRIRFTYQQGAENSSPRVFLDAAWLEVQTEELGKQIPAEPPLQVIGEGKVILKSIKKDWRRDEEPEFEISDAPQGFWEKIKSLFQKEEKTAVLIDPAGNEISENIIIQGSKVKISKPNKGSFRPGLYKLKITIIEGGEKFIQEQEFTWGVLAINTSKSIYLSNETAYLQMAALRDDGHTICDANLKLEIINPNGERSLANVERSGKCGPNNVIDVPDYFAYYQISQSGTYQIKLTNLDNGYEITDSFETRESVPFDVERIGSTRIYPLEYYPVTFSITSNQDFKGVVEERVPASFKISQPVYSRKYNSIREEGDVKLIRWEISLQAGEQIQFGYRFDAPDISPYLYLLGPLKIGDFQEIRQWQIASDLINEVFLFWDGVANTPDGTWTCVSCSPGDTYYQKFPIASSTAGLIGAGGSSHQHSVSLVSDGGAATGGYEPGAGVNKPTAGHTHPSVSGNTAAASPYPAYYELKVIKKENPTTIPAGVIAIFDTTSLPSADWQLYTAAVGNYVIRGGPNASTTAAGHAHTSGTYTLAANTAQGAVKSGAKAGEAVGHTHTSSAGAASATINLPPYVGVILAKTTVQVNLSDSSGMIAMFDNASLPTDWAAVTAMNNNYFLKATSTNGSEGYGATGGSTTHTHPDVANIIFSATADTTAGDSDVAPATAGADIDHTHTVGISFSSSASTLPPYVGTIFAKYTYTPPSNAAPTITNVVFYDGNAFTPNEWTQAAGGTKIATTTFTVTDTNTCADISTTTLYLYHSDVANCSTTAQASPTNCYPSTSTASAWTPRYGNGDLCSQTSCSGDTATFLCTSTLYFSASSTAVWMAFASTSDLSYAQANRTSNVGSAQATVNALQALEVSNDIGYATLLPGQDSGQSWVTTTATSTGNTTIDIKFHGGSLTKSGDDSKHIPAFLQQFTTTSNLAYGAASGVVSLATSTGVFTGDVHDVTMVKATGTVPYPSSADNILWGIGIPSGQAIGTYSSTTNFVVTTAIVVP